MDNLKKNNIDLKQCRAARAFLDWSQEELAKRIRVAKSTIVDFEKGKTTPQRRTIEDIKIVFEAAGVEFEDTDKTFGIRIKKTN